LLYCLCAGSFCCIICNAGTWLYDNAGWSSSSTNIVLVGCLLACAGNSTGLFATVYIAHVSAFDIAWKILLGVNSLSASSVVTTLTLLLNSCWVTSSEILAACVPE